MNYKVSAVDLFFFFYHHIPLSFSGGSLFLFGLKVTPIRRTNYIFLKIKNFLRRPSLKTSCSREEQNRAPAFFNCFTKTLVHKTVSVLKSHRPHKPAEPLSAPFSHAFFLFLFSLLPFPFFFLFPRSSEGMKGRGSIPVAWIAVDLREPQRPGARPLTTTHRTSYIK